VIPHFDRFAAWMPDLVTRYLTRPPEGVSVVGIDEDTALVWDGGCWTVSGRQSVWVLEADGRQEHAHGQVVDLPAPVD